MPRLFAEQFLVAPITSDRPEPEYHYDDERHLNVMADGRPVAVCGRSGGTDTLTEVRAEADDYDQPGDDDPLALVTFTKVKAERDDFAVDALSLATETRIQPGEKDDFASDLLLGTYTAGDGEPDDDDIEARAAADGWSMLDAATKTSVRGEADDFWSDGDDPPFPAPAVLRP